jgi:hypothetical protein
MKAVSVGILVCALFAGATRLSADGTWGLGVNGGFNTYAMSQMNQYLSDNDTGLALPSSGAQLGVAADVKYRFAEHWIAGLEANYLFAKASNSSVQMGLPITASIAANATEYLLDGSFVFPSGLPGLQLSVGLGIGVVVLTGDTFALSIPDALFQMNAPMYGSGFDGKIFMGADYYFTHAWSLGLRLGYRDASLWPAYYTYNDTRNPFLNTNGGYAAFNYSGFNSQLELTWWI